ncbi:MAG: hypothetical protein AABW92_00405, partial [Nanoarchaeota archaeon]
MTITISQPELFYLLIPMGIILFLIMRLKFVKEDNRLVKSKGNKRFVFITRMIIFSLLLLALSNPHTEFRDESSNLTKIKVLVDKSDSMKLYDADSALAAIENSADVPVEIYELDMGKHSALGTAILSHLAPDENLLLITDGRNNFGTDLRDVALFASSLNSRLFALNLREKQEDASVVIAGPSKVISGAESIFKVTVNSVGSPDKNVKIFVDNSLVYDDTYRKEIEITSPFDSGNHVIKAVLSGNDAFPENNIFYKAVSVYEKPKILFVSKGSSPLLELYQNFYAVDISSDLNKNLDSYYAVVLDNIAGNELKNTETEKLADFLDNGNGLFVIGGQDSYDWGEYDKSRIANLLPVSIGQAKKKEDITNIVMLLDTGASGSGILKEGITYFDVQKSILVDVLQSIS